jgi:hypothetical protein
MKRTSKTSLLMLHGSLITAMLIIISVGVYSNHEAKGQSENATSTTNQTSQRLGNLTKADFSDVLTSLTNAREAIFGGDNLRALRSLNSADNNLYAVVDRVGPEVGDLLLQEIAPVRENINNAQEAVVDRDLAKALNDVNSASTTLVKFTIPLPAGETE